MAAKKKAPKKVIKARSPKRTETGRRVIPNPIKGKFIIAHKDGLRWLNGVGVVVDQLGWIAYFDDKDTAHTTLEDAAMLGMVDDADDFAVVPARELLEPSYEFAIDADGALELRVTTVTRASETAQTLFKARKKFVGEQNQVLEHHKAVVTRINSVLNKLWKEWGD